MPAGYAFPFPGKTLRYQAIFCRREFNFTDLIITRANFAVSSIDYYETHSNGDTNGTNTWQQIEILN